MVNSLHKCFSQLMTAHYKMKKVFCLLLLITSISAKREEETEEPRSETFVKHEGRVDSEGDTGLNDYQRRIINKVINVKAVDNNNLIS